MLPAILILTITLSTADEPETPAPSMTPAVACRTIKGFGDFEPLEQAQGEEEVVRLTADEKLLLYVEAERYAQEVREGAFQIHLIQDVNLRRKGQKKILLGREKAVEFRHSGEEPLSFVFLATTIGLKGLPPGDYEAELILRDELAGGARTSQVFRFRVVRPRAS